MRRLCLVGFSFAAATLACAYGLPAALWLPLAAVLLAAGIAALLLRRTLWFRRVGLCLLGAAVGLAYYALHWQLHILPARAWDGQEIAAEAELRQAPTPTRYGASALAWLYADGRRMSVLLYLDDTPDDADIYEPGDRLRGTFRLKLPSDEADDAEPGYLRSCGVYLTASPQGEVEQIRPDRLPLRLWPARVRQRMTALCQRLFSAETAPWFRALLTNDNSGLPYADKNALKLAGLYHSVCTSGMHIHILMGAVTLLCLRRRRLAAAIGLPVCVFFWAVAGGTPSASRAVVMQALLLAAPLLLREQDTPTSLALALTVILLRRPDAIAHLGLQLSFLSVAGISLLYRRVERSAFRRRMNDRLRRRSRLLRGAVRALNASLTSSLGALLLTTPLLAWRYGVFSLVSPLSGLLCLWAVTVCFAAGLPVLLLGMAAPGAAAVLALPLEWLMRFVIWTTRALAALPGAALYLSAPYWVAWLAAAYGFVLLAWLGRLRPGRLLGCLLLSFGLALGFHMLELHLTEPAQFRLTALDVGQGQCLVLRSGGETCVIDCGGSWPEDAGERCARYLLGQGVRRIDRLVLTHYHADHAGGVMQLLSRLPAEAVYAPELEDDTGLRAAIAAAAGPAFHPVTEDTALLLGTGRLTLYAPRSLAGDNEACLAVLASFGEDDLLVTGDMSAGTELLLCKSADLPDVEILVAGHHGSRSASGEAFLARILPEVVIISCEAGNRYGHPHAETLARFAALGSAVLRTDELGNLTIER